MVGYHKSMNSLLGEDDRQNDDTNDRPFLNLLTYFTATKNLDALGPSPMKI